MTWAVWLSFAIISAVNIVTPGPANLNTVRRAVQVGFRRVVPTILGNALGLAIGGVACALGIGTLLKSSEALWIVFQIVGVAYLAWLGIKLFIKRETLVLDALGTEAVAGFHLFVEALLLATTNPKALLFYIALFPQVLDFNSNLAPQVAILIMTYCALSVLSLSAYSILATLLRTRFMNQARYDKFRQVSGLILLGFSIKLLAELM